MIATAAGLGIIGLLAAAAGKSGGVTGLKK
jgi:hypothetical protein